MVPDHQLSFEPYDLAQMTPPVSPIPPRVNSPPQLFADFSVACSLITSNISERQRQSQQRKDDYGVAVASSLYSIGATLNSSQIASASSTPIPTSTPGNLSSSFSATNASVATSPRPDGRPPKASNQRASNQRTTPLISLTVGFSPPSDDLHKSTFSTPPSHGATQRVRSKTVSGIPVALLPGVKTPFGHTGAVAMLKGNPNNMPETPAPTPPPPFFNGFPTSQTQYAQIPSQASSPPAQPPHMQSPFTVHSPVQPLPPLQQPHDQQQQQQQQQLLLLLQQPSTQLPQLLPPQQLPQRQPRTSPSPSPSPSHSHSHSPALKVKASTPPPNVIRRPGLTSTTATTTTTTTITTTKPPRIVQAEASTGVPIGILSDPFTAAESATSPQLPAYPHHPSSSSTKSSSHSSKHNSARRAYKMLRAEDRTCQAENPAATRPVHSFVDMSNLIIGYYDACKKVLGKPVDEPLSPLPRFEFKAFNKVLLRDRETAKREAAGSYSKGKVTPTYLLDAEKSKYSISVLNRVSGSSSDSRGSRGSRAREQCVDEVLHLKMAQSVLDCDEPGVIVLATGDANRAQFSDGFLKAVERALNHGWVVELVSWKNTMSQAWLEPEWRARWATRFRVIELDPFFDYLLEAEFARQLNLRPSSPSTMATTLAMDTLSDPSSSIV